MFIAFNRCRRRRFVFSNDTTQDDDTPQESERWILHGCAHMRGGIYRVLFRIMHRRRRPRYDGTCTSPLRHEHAYTERSEGFAALAVYSAKPVQDTKCQDEPSLFTLRKPGEQFDEEPYYIMIRRNRPAVSSIRCIHISFTLLQQR